MASALQTTVTQLPESRVRVQAEVPAEEVERRLSEKARALGREMKIAGFRAGKVPPPVVLGRIGREAVLEQAVRDSLGRWYAAAVDNARIVTVGDPQLDLEALPGPGEALRFSIEIGVLPNARLGPYRGVEAPRRDPEVQEEAIGHELEQLRERLGRLEPVDRPAARGDFVVVDYRGEVDGDPVPGGQGRDELVELGAGRVVPGLEEGLLGASAGDEREIDTEFPADHAAPELAGRAARFSVTVKEVREKRLPELDDDLAVDAAGLDSLDELRRDIATRLREVDEQRAEAEFREAALDAVVAQADVEVPGALVESRARELWERTVHSLSHQGISAEAYLRIAGKTEPEILSEARPDAEQALRREAVVTAVVAAEGIEITDQDVLDALGPMAEREASTPEDVLQALRRSGRLESAREDVAARRALELIAREAKPIPAERARAREKLWTPEQPQSTPAEANPPDATPARLWTPG